MYFLFFLEKKSCTCDKNPATCTTHPIIKCRQPVAEGDEKKSSGAGILEFTPARAGQDVTPLGLDFRPASPANSPKIITASKLSKILILFRLPLSASLNVIIFE